MLNTRQEIEVWLEKHGVDNYAINDDMTVDVKGSVNLYDFDLTALPVQFGIVSGDFDCSENKLKSLTGSPRTVSGSFSCAHNLLEDLKGGPTTIGEDMNCQRNRLFTLDGAPKVIGDTLYCVDNPLAEIGEISTTIGSRYIGPLIREFREHALDHGSIEVEAVNFNSIVLVKMEKRTIERAVPKIETEYKNSEAINKIAMHRQAQGLPPVPQRDANPVATEPSQAPMKKTFKL